MNGNLRGNLSYTSYRGVGENFMVFNIFSLFSGVSDVFCMACLDTINFKQIFGKFLFI